MKGKIQNVVIKSTNLDINDRELLQAWLHTEHEGGGQGFGGYALYLPKSFTHHELKSHAGHFIFRVCEIAGAKCWEELKGKNIRVDRDQGQIYGIGHIYKDDWFYPKEDFKEDPKQQ